MKRISFIVLVASLLWSARYQPQETPRMGGVLKVRVIVEPPTLDIPMSPRLWCTRSLGTSRVAAHLRHRTSTRASARRSWTLADKGLRYTIVLRRGASYPQRQGDYVFRRGPFAPAMVRVNSTSTGRVLWKYIESVDANDPIPP